MWLFEKPLFYNDFITIRILQSATLHGKHLTEEGEYSFPSLQITSIGGSAEERSAAFFCNSSSGQVWECGEENGLTDQPQGP